MNIIILKSNKKRGTKLLMLLTIFVSSFFFSKNVFAATLHSTEQGGHWDDPTTWEEGVIPTENDNVEIYGSVLLQHDYRIQNVHINENAALFKNSFGGITFHARSLRIEQGARFVSNNLNISLSGDIYNYGDTTDCIITVGGNVYNYGNMKYVYLEGNTARELIGFENIEYTQLNTNVTFSNNPSFKEIRLQNHEISFDHESGYIASGHISAQNGASIHGELKTLTNGTQLDFSSLSVEKLSINHHTTFNHNIVLFGDLVINENTSLQQNGHNAADFTLNGNLTLQPGASFSSNNNALDIMVHGNITNDGSLNQHVRIHSFADVINHGSLSYLFLEGTQERSLQGIDTVTTIYINDHINALTSITLGDTHFAQESSINFVHPIDTLTFIGTLSGSITTNAPIFIDNNTSFSGGDIHAPLLTILEGTLFSFFSDIHFYTPVIIQTSSTITRIQGGHGRLFFHKALLIKENVNYQAQSYVMDNMDIHSNITSIFFLSHGEETEPYTFQYSYDRDTIDHNGITTSQHTLRQLNIEGNTFFVREIINAQTPFFWRSTSNTSPWSSIHSINVPLYLEENNHFFTTTNISDTTENEEQTITITAEDSDYTGDIELSVDEGQVIPSTVHMENGTITTNVSFDTPQENIKLYLQSNDHSTLSGESNSFTINHHIQYTFFTVPVIDNGEVEREMIITLNASEEDYEGDVSIRYHYTNQEGQGITENLNPVHFVQGNPITQFSFIPQETTQNAYFSFEDTNKDYLLGTSNHFYVIPKPHHNIGSIIRRRPPQTFGNTFWGQGGGEKSSPPLETEQEETNEETNNEQNEEETEELNYLLENTCLNIHSIYPSLSKSRRTLLKSIPREKQNVKNLQQKLKDLHFLNGQVDGDYGNQTTQALQDFQEQNNLTPDGIFGNGSSHFIESHCNNLEEKITEEPEEQNQNDENDNENNEQEDLPADEEGQAPSGETTLWEDIWNIYSNPILYLINHADDIGGWVSGLFGINNVNNIDQFNNPVLEDDENNEIIEVSDTVESDNILISFADGINQDVVSVYTLNVLKDILVNSDNSYALITSTARTPERQADIMIHNIKLNGIQSQYDLYSKYGDMVIDMYPDRQAMIDKIYEIGPQKVSKHLADFTKNNVIDISPGSIEYREKFRMVVKNDSRVSKAFFPEEQGGENAYHLVIPQNQL